MHKQQTYFPKRAYAYHTRTHTYTCTNKAFCCFYCWWLILADMIVAIPLDTNTHTYVYACTMLLLQLFFPTLTHTHLNTNSCLLICFIPPLQLLSSVFVDDLAIYLLTPALNSSALCYARYSVAFFLHTYTYLFVAWLTACAVLVCTRLL